MHQSSFRRLALSHYDLLYGAAMHAARSLDRAVDLVRETYRIAFERWRTLRDPAACRAWLLRLVHNVDIDEIGRTRRLAALEGDGFEVPDLRMLADAFRGVAASLTLEHLQRLLG